MTTLRYLAYASKITLKASFDKALLRTIANEATELNHDNGITGFLCFGGGQFFQYIEGHPDAIERLVNNLRHDKRHQQFHIIVEGTRDKRQFHEWDMFCLDLDRLEESGRIAKQLERFEPLSWQGTQAQALIAQMAQYYQSPTYPPNLGFEPHANSHRHLQVTNAYQRHQHFLLLQLLLIGVAIAAIIVVAILKFCYANV